MARDLPDIDRLIEEGLTLYGQGELDAALLAWERVLSIEPEHPQATSYVDYVRMNYELLTAETSGEDPHGAPFGIEEEPEYLIEIVPGELIAGAAAPLYMDPLDDAWFIEDESAPRRPRTRSVDEVPVTLELEADEPPLRPSEPQPIGFEDQTREYPGGPPARAPSELPTFESVPDPVTSEFHPEVTPGFGTPADYQTPAGGFTQVTPSFDTPTSGFGTQVTDIRKRETGFVQPTPARHDPAEDELTLRRPSQGPPDLKMTLRTPGEDAADAPPPASSLVELSYDDPTTERPLDAAAADLINSLPSPTPAQRYDPGPPKSTRDLPPVTRAPAPPTAELRASSTRDFPAQKTEKLAPAPSDTRDFPAQKTERLPGGVRFITPEAAESTPTRDLPTGKLPSFAREMMTAPTRDLGLRPLDARAASPVLDDESTIHRKRQPTDGTRADVILPFDPIDARSAQILDDVDVGAPDREPKEDRTRRRITTLFERAIEWSRGAELDRAVAAVDLALSEDPNSALAQKLIHRNRDTMMTVFQTFLGDLQRQPTLARPLHELATAPISPRAAFLLSRVDGTLSLDEILDVSGMPRLEAYRYLCQLFLRGILR